MQEIQTEDTEILEIKSVSLVDATLQTAKKSFSELVKETPIDKKAKELKSQLKKLEIQGIDDKENYNKVKAISKDASKVRIAVEKRRKELKADIILAGKQIDTLANEYQALINPVENEADAKLKVVDDLIEAEKARKEREDKERTDKRKDELEANGLAFTGQWWTIGEIQVGIQQISEMSEEEYPKFLEKVKVQNEKNIEAKRIADEAEQKRLQEIENQRLENERIQKENEAKQKELDDKLKAIADAENALAEKKKTQRHEELRPYIVYIRDYNKMISLPDEEYQKEFADIKEAHRLQMEYDQKEQLKQIEEQRQKEQKEREEAELIANNAKKYEDLGYKFSYQTKEWFIQIGDYFNRITKDEMLADKEYTILSSRVTDANLVEEKRIKLEAEAKAEKEKKEAEEQEAKRKSLLTDQQAYGEWIEKLKSLTPPTVNDSAIQLKINTIIETINQ